MADPKKTDHTADDERKGQQSSRLVTADARVEESHFVNLTIKVHKRQRLHWLIEAKKQGTSLTAAIMEALNERFGAPE